jgi:hypothetical protein
MLNNPQANILVSADSNDILANHVALRSAGPGTYRVWARAAAAADATITINDGKSDVVSTEPILTEAAGTTYPVIDLAKDIPWEVTTNAKDRLRIDVVDGTNGEIVVKVVKIR